MFPSDFFWDEDNTVLEKHQDDRMGSKIIVLIYLIAVLFGQNIIDQQ